jgi:D-3-phosphoglycerate dehydrogenase
MKVAITDYTFPDLTIEEEILRSHGFDVEAIQQKPPVAELIQLIADADAVITQFASLTAEVIARMKQARVIVRYGIGVDNVDLEAAKAMDIPVCNVPDYCLDEVADQTLAFLLATTRQVIPNCLSLRGGRWGLAVPLDAMRAVRDLTVGVVGFGRIGREVTARLLGFKCRILVHDPVISPIEIEAAGAKTVTLGDLMAKSDVITLHCPSTPQTRGMIDEKALSATKRGVVIINNARGDLINLNALTDALQTGHVSAAALDVFAPEPIPSDHPILKMDNVIVASHIASASVPAVTKLRRTAAQLAVKALKGEPLPNVINGVTRTR